MWSFALECSEGNGNLVKTCKVESLALWEVILECGPEERMPLEDRSAETALSTRSRLCYYTAGGHLLTERLCFLAEPEDVGVCLREA